MTTHSNQELYEMIQALTDQNYQQQRIINNLCSQLTMIENDFDDFENRSNRLIEKMVTKSMFNNSMEIQKRYGLNDIRGRL